MSAICIFGDSAHSRATLECQKQSEFDCLPTSSGKDMQLVIFCICSLCSPRVTPLYLFSHMDRQSFLAHDGIQTLDMLSLGFGPNKDRFSS